MCQVICVWKTLEKEKYTYTKYRTHFSEYIFVHNSNKIIKSWIFIADQRLISEKLKALRQIFVWDKEDLYSLYNINLISNVTRYFLSVFL